jgi:hypothetical protein
MDPEYHDVEVTPKIGDNYLSAELMLPKGGVLVMGCVTARKRDRDGNPVGHANDNPILDLDHTLSILMMVTRLNSMPI